jgi:hypothetical protein
VAKGDFYGDGGSDIAVVALSDSIKPRVVILIFFDGDSGRSYPPVLIPRSELSVMSLGLFSRPPRLKQVHSHWRLLWGTFGSEADEITMPNRKREN